MAISTERNARKRPHPSPTFWNWGRYHAELLRRSRALPPLMRSLWSERANHAAWLAPERFPLPTYRLEPSEDGAPHIRALAEASVVFDEKLSMFVIEARCGTVAHVLRGSLLAALIDADASRRQEFFGCSLDEPETPRIAYVSWRALIGGPDDPEVFPEQTESGATEDAKRGRRMIQTPSLWALMEQSLPFVAGEAGDPLAAADRDELHEPAACPDRVDVRKDTDPNVPTMLVIDTIDAPASYNNAIIAIARKLERVAALFWSIAHPREAVDSGRNWTPTIILSTSGHIPHRRLAHATSRESLAYTVFVDAPAASDEHLTFMEAWERWCRPQARSRVVERDAAQRLAEVEQALASLGMVSIGRGREGSVATPQDVTHIATFDLRCAICAILRDDMPCATPSQLWSGLAARLQPDERRSVHRALVALHQGRAFLLDIPSVELLGFANEYNLLPSSSVMRLSNMPASELVDLVNRLASFDEKDFRRLVDTVMTDLRANPLLSGLLLPKQVENQAISQIQLLNEPLAMAIIASDAVTELERTSDGDEAGGLFTVALMMSDHAWAHFIEAVFELLAERDMAFLARYLLEKGFVLFLALSSHAIPLDVDEEISGLIDDVVDETYRGALVQTSAELAERAEATRAAGYGDALVRASLRYDLQTGGVVPVAWAWWVAAGISAEEIAAAVDPDGPWNFAVPDDATVAERVSFLRELLHEPVPACDNALLLLRLLGMA